MSPAGFKSGKVFGQEGTKVGSGQESASRRLPRPREPGSLWNHEEINKKRKNARKTLEQEDKRMYKVSAKMQIYQWVVSVLHLLT
ncbi:hypothetical protein QG37_01746 [Candidozyma auris]|nr:hypothetical protein QG37_01746 [[Candida] auris]